MNQKSVSASKRPVTEADEPFLQALYESTRSDLDFLEPPARSFILTQQYDAQKRSYQNEYPNAEWSIILCGEQPIGVLVIQRESGLTRVVNIALLPSWRGMGIGSAILRSLASQSQALELSVLVTNPALRLYQRLGFKEIGADSMYLHLRSGN